MKLNPRKVWLFCLKWPVALLILLVANTVIAVVSMGLWWYVPKDNLLLQGLLIVAILVESYGSVWLVQKWLLSRSFEFQAMKVFLWQLAIANVFPILAEIIVILGLLGDLY